ncbi:hypothetical protein AMELA_G00198160 [Ameiurus melas]|uniref:Uncharacterized protein n=1 Tax=Ameiurus melas TaxID=219545 RepID=A0A7J6A6C7_AMEME|nr:hypothetical protein AMELA_G00198160 [Ameiurus melas]
MFSTVGDAICMQDNSWNLPNIPGSLFVGKEALEKIRQGGMDPSSVSYLDKPSSGIFKGRPTKQSQPPEKVQMDCAENDNHGPTCNERTDIKKKGCCRVEVPDLCTIPPLGQQREWLG